MAVNPIRSQPSLSAVRRLLEAEGLPTSDLQASQLEHFFIAGPEEKPQGIVGLEVFADVALLRSLVVQRGARGRGLGHALVRHAEDYAALRHVGGIYLLTTTAEKFFQGLGYKSVARCDAPVSIQQTREFASLCPASSAFMMKRLKAR